MKQLHLIIYIALLLSACQHGQPGQAECNEARRLQQAGDAPAALEQLQKAWRMATTDSLRAVIQSRMGTLYFDQRLLDRSLACYQRAYDIDLHNRDTVGLIYDLRDIGNVYRATDDRTDSCLSYFQAARRLAVASGNIPMLRDVESQLAAYHLYRNQLTEAKALLMPALAYADSASRSGLYFMLADYYARMQQHDSAIWYYRRLISPELSGGVGAGSLYARMAAHRALAEYCLQDLQASPAQREKLEEALLHLKQYELLTDSVIAENDAEALRRISALYDYTMQQQENARLERHLLTAGIGMVLLMLVAALMLLYFIRRRLHYRLKVQRLEQLLERHNSQHPERKAQAQTAITGTAVYQHISRLLADSNPQPLDDEDWHRLEDAVAEAFPGWTGRLQEFCRLTAQERHVTLLLKVGIPPMGIALLTAHSKQSVTNTRSRLYQKAFGRKGTPAQWDEFVQSL